MADLLNEDEIASRLRRLTWEREGDEIAREWRFEDFSEAVAGRAPLTPGRRADHASGCPLLTAARALCRSRWGLLLPFGPSLNERRRPTPK